MNLLDQTNVPSDWAELALSAFHEPDAALDRIRTVVVDWLPRLLGRDESRHIAFGIHYLRTCLPGLGAERRAALERNLERWGAAVHDMASDPDVIYDAGVAGARIGTRCIADINLRLAQVGMEAPIRGAG
jgi:hypothetical protein